MDETALGGRHRLELHRPPEIERVRHRAVSGTVQSGLAPIAVPGGVDHHLPVGRAALVRHAQRKVLERVDRAPVLTDQDPEILAVDGRADRVVGLLDVNARAHVQRRRDPRHQRTDPLGGLVRQLLTQ
jgi:hypothetical protein